MDPTTVSGALVWIVRHPWDALGRRWNYKSAVLSSLMRAALFFGTNVSAGRDAAFAAMTTELCFRLATAGFYGAVTQAFRKVEPAAAGMITAIVVLPLIAHSLEFLVHWWRQTALLGPSIAASVVFTALSTAFNLFAMRQGAFVVGEDKRSLLSDLLSLPRLMTQFVRAAFRTFVRACA